MCVAGATDLMAGGWDPAGSYLDLSALAALAGIRETEAGIEIGALVTCAALSRHAVIRARLPLLAQSAAATGSWAIQNRATLGGNVMNASPAADNPPVLLAYGAQVRLASERGLRSLPYEEFHTGYKTTACAADEIVHSFLVPVPDAGSHQYFRKVGTRRAQAISKVTLALAGQAGREGLCVRIGLASVGPMPVLARTAAAVLRAGRTAACTRERLQEALRADIAPQDDIRSTRLYRDRVAFNLLKEALCGFPTWSDAF